MFKKERIPRKSLPKEVRRWRLGYKILIVSHDGRRISRAWSLPSVVVYPKEQIVYRPKGCGPLAVFEDFDDALREFRLIRENFGYEKRLVDAPTEAAKEPILVSCLWKPSRAKSLWFRLPAIGENGIYSRVSVHHAPEGTRLADAVYCLA